jgi:hypothetical protein
VVLQPRLPDFDRVYATPTASAAWNASYFLYHPADYASEHPLFALLRAALEPIGPHVRLTTQNAELRHIPLKTRLSALDMLLLQLCSALPILICWHVTAAECVLAAGSGWAALRAVGPAEQLHCMRAYGRYACFADCCLK